MLVGSVCLPLLNRHAICLNPLNINPLRFILLDRINFDRVVGAT